MSSSVHTRSVPGCVFLRIISAAGTDDRSRKGYLDGFGLQLRQDSIRGGTLHVSARASLRLAAPVQPSRQECVGLCRATHLAQECDTRAAHAFAGAESHLKAEAVEGGHRRLRSLAAGIPLAS